MKSCRLAGVLSPRIALCALTALLVSPLASCSRAPRPGPDKQGAGMLAGAAVGAGAGAVTGFQLSAATGPGAAVGAGVGAVAGGLKGLVQDQVEEDMLKTSAELREQREIAAAQEILQDHYRRRMELHPTRDIYPAELFFDADQVHLKCSAHPLVREIAKLNRARYPWSRLVIATYTKSSDENSMYARHLAERRARELGDQFISAGIEPRRIETRSVIVSAPVLIDPADRPDRYNEAIELIPVDR